ncbi:MAG: methionyl-tRNA formyltransferase [Firmicutes bacterium]|nr:methionyl-tRNA formyltransferase [Bacillota bacterium]
MNKKGYIALEHFIKKYGLERIECVISTKDKGLVNDYSRQINVLVLAHQIDFYERDGNFKINSNYIFAIGWRWLIPFKGKLIVFHDSLLPKYRGFAPLVNQLINRENKIGVTALLASKEYDRGDIIEQRYISISYPIKIEEVINQLTPMYSELVIKIYNNIRKVREIKAYKQNETESSYSLWRDEDDYRINWGKGSDEIKRFIAEVGYPYLGTSTLVENKKVRVLEAEIVSDQVVKNRTPGKVIFSDGIYPIIVCGQGLLKVKNLIDD